MARSAVEIVTDYVMKAWNEGRADLVPELCADPIVRHDANSVVRLSHAEQMARIHHNYEELRPIFEDIVLAGDDRHVTLVWNATGRDPNWKLCGIEIFRVTDGKIAEVWNSPYLEGRWGLSRALSGRAAGGIETDFPIVSADLSAADTGGTIVVPVDARNIGRWLGQTLSPAGTSEAGDAHHHVYGPAEAAGTLAIAMTDSGKPALAIDDARIATLSIALAASGLVNATIAVSGTAGPGVATADIAPAPAVVRLSETIGTLARDGVDIGRVVDATITLDPGSPGATGRVTLRLADAAAAASAAGNGQLRLGWRQEDFRLLFEGAAVLGEPTNLFTDKGELEATYQWRADRVTATIVNDRPA